MSLAIDYSEGKFELGKNTLILGPYGSGKTNLILTNIFLRNQSKINFLFVVSKDQKYKEITSHLFEDYQLPKIFQEIQTLNRLELKLLIIDDISYPNNPIIECILINSNYFNITVILVSQIGNLNMISRDYIDNIVIGSQKCSTISRNIFEKFIPIYGDVRHFQEVVGGLGKYEFLFVSKNKMSVGIIRVNDHWMKYLYSYKMVVRYDIVSNIAKYREQDLLIQKVNYLMTELLEIKKKIAN